MVSTQNEKNLVYKLRINLRDVTARIIQLMCGYTSSIDRLTKFFFRAVPVKIYPDFPVAVIFNTRITLIVEPVQSTAHHCMNLCTKIQIS